MQIGMLLIVCAGISLPQKIEINTLGDSCNCVSRITRKPLKLPAGDRENNININCGDNTISVNECARDTSSKEDRCTIGWPNIYTGLIDIFKSGIWPFVVLLLGLFYRTEFSSLLSRLKKGKFAGSEFEFEGRVKDVVDELNEIDPNLINSSPNPQAVYGKDVRGVILSAWLNLEGALQSKITESKISFGKNLNINNIANVIRILRQNNMISIEQSSILNDLRHIRNLAAHSTDFDPEPESVKQYLNLISALTAQLSSQGRTP